MRTDDHRDVERRLREAFAASEAITHDWDDAPAHRPGQAGSTQTTSHRWRAPLLAAAVVLAVAAVPTALLALRHDPKPTSAGTQPSPSRSAFAASPTVPSAKAKLTGPPTTSAPGANLGPARAQVGVTYPFDLLTHCGIHYTNFGGRTWQVATPQPAPSRLPDPSGITTETGYTSGVVVLVNPSTLKFTVTDPLSAAYGKSFVFTPATGPAPLCA